MISLSLGQILIVYTALAVVTVFLVSLTSHLCRIWAERRARRRLVHCAFCGVIYEASSPADPLPPCPGCSKPNERIPPLGV